MNTVPQLQFSLLSGSMLPNDSLFSFDEKEKIVTVK